MEKPVLRADKLTKTFGEGHIQVRAVDGISFSIEAGELVLVMGPSGSGKTTFLSMLGGLLKPTSGTVKLGNSDLWSLNEKQLSKARATQIGFIFQSFNLLDAISVEDNILLPAQLGKQSVSEAKERANWLMERLGLTHRRNAIPGTLSGGEKQRVAIARALINEPQLILADEPTGNLDSQSGQEVMMILHDVARDTGVGVLIVTHDPRVEEVADRILWLEDGRISDRKAEAHSWVIDPVCGMRVDEWRAVHFSAYANLKFTFCSKRCKQRFDESPTSFIPKEESIVSGE